MDVRDIDATKYTHVHFAFARFTPDFKVDVSSMRTQFDRFKGLKEVKRVISFGGWADSTKPDKY